MFTAERSGDRCAVNASVTKTRLKFQVKVNFCHSSGPVAYAKVAVTNPRKRKRLLLVRRCGFTLTGLEPSEVIKRLKVTTVYGNVGEKLRGVTSLSVCIMQLVIRLPLTLNQFGFLLEHAHTLYSRRDI